MAPDLRRVRIEGENAIAKRVDNGRQPSFKTMRLIRVAAVVG